MADEPQARHRTTLGGNDFGTNYSTWFIQPSAPRYHHEGFRPAGSVAASQNSGSTPDIKLLTQEPFWPEGSQDLPEIVDPATKSWETQSRQQGSNADGNHVRKDFKPSSGVQHDLGFGLGGGMADRVSRTGSGQDKVPDRPIDTSARGYASTSVNQRPGEVATKAPSQSIPPALSREPKSLEPEVHSLTPPTVNPISITRTSGVSYGT